MVRRAVIVCLAVATWAAAEEPDVIDPLPPDPAAIDDHWNHDDPAGTEAAFREMRPALEAGGDASFLLQLDTQIARTYSLQRRFDDAHALLDTIETRLETAAPVVRVRYLLERGRTLNSSGDKEALECRREAGDVETTEIAEWCVARCLRSLDRVEDALAAQWDLLHRKEERGSDNDGYVFEELGECLHELGRAEEARPWFGKAYGVLSQDERLLANEAERLARLNELGGL